MQNYFEKSLHDIETDVFINIRFGSQLIINIFSTKLYTMNPIEKYLMELWEKN